MMKGCPTTRAMPALLSYSVGEAEGSTSHLADARFAPKACKELGLQLSGLKSLRFIQCCGWLFTQGTSFNMWQSPVALRCRLAVPSDLICSPTTIGIPIIETSGCSLKVQHQ